jgi:hypothetical protein
MINIISVRNLCKIADLTIYKRGAEFRAYKLSPSISIGFTESYISVMRAGQRTKIYLNKEQELQKILRSVFMEGKL